MSNRPPNQSLEEPIAEILSGLNDFTDAAHRRLECGEWTQEHENLLVELIGSMTHLKAKLLRLSRHTW